MKSLAAILFDIDGGDLTLPKFQRGYVWQRSQVRELMRSLYEGFPVGSFLIWKTDALAGSGTHTFLLDGQQRITSLYGIIRGMKPAFSDGDPKAFLNLYFNLDYEVFEFKSSKMTGDPSSSSMSSNSSYSWRAVGRNSSAQDMPRSINSS